jgi:hypothetical protein
MEDNRIPEKIPSEQEIYQANKAKNNEKSLFFQFLINNTKIEVHLEQLQSYLFWNAFLEYLTWLVLLALFISSPKSLAVIWVLFYHNARATVGLFILRHMPKTHQVVENLRDYENNSLEDIQKSMEENYISLIHNTENVLKPLLITYFILTVLSLIIDVVMFFVIASYFHKQDSQQKVFFCLIAIIVYIICDLVYFEFMGSLRFSFSPETLIPIRRAVLGYFNNLKSGIASGFRLVINKISRRRVEEGVQNQAQA